MHASARHPPTFEMNSVELSCISATPVFTRRKIDVGYCDLTVVFNFYLIMSDEKGGLLRS
jgi:hypothetical protein